MNLGISFAPLVPAYAVWAAFVVAALLAATLLLVRSRGALMRAIAMALMVLALADPSLTREDREPIPSVAAVIVDKSPSQEFGDRPAQTEAARKAIVDRLHRIPGLEVRVAEAGQADGETDGTRLFSALASTLSDVPPDRVAGAIMITDGRVHDIPANAAIAPEIANTVTTTHPVGTPEAYAARALVPVANIHRPNKVPCSSTAIIIAATTMATNIHGIPAICAASSPVRPLGKAWESGPRTTWAMPR
jgi:hypothetical protein